MAAVWIMSCEELEGACFLMSAFSDEVRDEVDGMAGEVGAGGRRGGRWS